ncbi:MAG TPA: Rieske 2Fe-2S domain-containing protein [Actinomycetota bacterium]|jgi:nitrite reductase/ring-hydroxylating ferredoxin subunit/uncharacterized membrane protein|nr:Rieske 2Fe-2S domain-containing protein [Actinomycetota bacterium]
MSRRIRSIADRVAEIEPLDAVADPVGSSIVAAVPQGRTKDLLSGTWLGHPVHPMLTDVVVGSWVSAAILDLLGERGEEAADALVGVGIAAAVPTAVTGLSDWADTAGEARRIGLVHGIGNVLALGLYSGSLALRRRGRRSSGIALSMLGAATATITQYLGGHLVFGQGVGVNQTAFEGGPEAWTPIGDLDDLQERVATRRRVGDVDVMLYRDRDRVRAIADRCGHRGCSLSEGEIDGATVTCACHGSVFRLADGEVLQGPATGPQTAFETRTRDGVVEIREKRGSFTSSGLR